MTKLALKGCAIALYVLLAWASGVGSVHADEQEMSPEEKARRKEECWASYKSCTDWCDKRHPKNAVRRGHCRDDCMSRLLECLDKIPSDPRPPNLLPG